jgi:thiosulfate dehydrogenase
MTALAVAAAAAAAIWLVLPADPPPAPEAASATAEPVEWPIRAPDPATIPEGPLGDAIRRGQQLVTHTRDELPEHVGADLNCTSCHLKGGTVPDAGPWVGLPGEFPEYRARNDKVVTLEGRVNDCFERSMNGEPIDPAGQDMTAIVAYMTWLSKDVPVGVPVEGRGFAKIADPPEADAVRGKALYAQKCAACHGAGGQGLDAPDGSYLYPRLWGERRFNMGAGMARLDTAAAFVHDNMPLGQGGTLTEQEAYDVAAYFTTQPRPDFAGKAQDWPKGNKPRDARY